MPSKVFGRRLRTTSLCNCYLLCVLFHCISSVFVCLSALLANKRVHNSDDRWHRCRMDFVIGRVTWQSSACEWASVIRIYYVDVAIHNVLSRTDQNHINHTHAVCTVTVWELAVMPVWRYGDHTAYWRFGCDRCSAGSWRTTCSWAHLTLLVPQSLYNNMGARRHGQKGALALLCKMFLCISSYSKTFSRRII